MDCPKCHAPVEEAGARFCPSCGATLGDSPGTPNPTVPAGPKSKKSRIMIISLVCVLLVVGFFFRDAIARVLPFLNPSNYARSAEMAPADTDLFMVMNPDLGQVKNFTRIWDLYMSIPEVERAFEEFKSQFSSESGLDYKEDIEPWLGREMAVIIPDIEGSNGETFLLAVSTTSEKKTEACMEKMRESKEKQGLVFDEQTYQGVRIFTESQSYSTMAYALYDGFLLVSENENDIINAIDTSKGDKKLTLAKNETYQKIMKQLPGDRSGACYIDFDVVTSAISDEVSYHMGAYMQELEAYEGLGLSLAFTGEGARFDYAMAYDPEKLSRDVPPPGDGKEIEKTARMIPGDALAFIGGANLGYSLQTFFDEAPGMPGFEDLSMGMYYFEEETGINLERDIVSWLGSEIALAVVPSRDGMLAREIPVGVLAMIDVEDKEAARSAMERVVYALEAEGAGTSYSSTNGERITSLYEPYSGTTVAAYGFTGNYLVLSSSVQLVENVIEPSGKSLVDSETYKKAWNGQSSSYEGCIFVDVEEGLELVYQSLHEWEREYFRQSVYPFVDPVQSISFRQSRTGEDFITGSLAVIIK